MCFDIFGKQKEIDSLNDTISDLNEQLINVKSDEMELRMKMAPSPFEDFLNNRFKTATLKYQKRWVFAFDQAYDVDVRDFCKEWKTMPDVGSIEQVFKYNIQYVFDEFAKHGMVDYWQLPIETLGVGNKGDCEDSATMRLAMARKIGNKDVFIALGFYGTFGHAFNLMWKDGKVYIVENTSNIYNPQEIPGNDLKAGLAPYSINYVFNENQCWVIDGSMNFGKWCDSESRHFVGTHINRDK